MPDVSQTEPSIAIQNIDDANYDNAAFHLEDFIANVVLFREILKLHRPTSK